MRRQYIAAGVSRRTGRGKEPPEPPARRQRCPRPRAPDLHKLLDGLGQSLDPQPNALGRLDAER